VTGKEHTSKIVWLRRLVQSVFFVLFVYLFLQAEYHPIDRTGGPVTFFFEIDPLVLLTSWLASHKLVTALLLSLATVGITLVFGRWFCGWICPFGALHNFFTSLRRGSEKARILAGGYSKRLKAKYYILLALLGGALVGINLAGWLDPISFLYRSFATAVNPAANWAVTALFGWIYETDPGIGPLRATQVTEPVYEVLREKFLAADPLQYSNGILIGFLFAAVIALNFYRPRFWCRYLCPLGALLGVLGKNPVVQVETDPDKCNSCGLCLADCQGGASPDKESDWKPAECFFCWNCKSVCPLDAISIKVELPKEKKR